MSGDRILCGKPNCKARGVPAAIWCADCRMYFCASCEVGHKEWNEAHKTAPIAVVPSAPVFPGESVLLGCPEHPALALTKFCEQCKVPFCESCRCSHERHSAVPLDQSAGRMKEWVLLSTPKIGQALEAARLAKAKVNAQLDAVAKEKAVAKAELAEKFAKLLALLERTQAELLERSRCLLDAGGEQCLSSIAIPPYLV